MQFLGLGKKLISFGPSFTWKYYKMSITAMYYEMVLKFFQPSFFACFSCFFSNATRYFSLVAWLDHAAKSHHTIMIATLEMCAGHPEVATSDWIWGIASNPKCFGHCDVIIDQYERLRLG